MYDVRNYYMFIYTNNVTLYRGTGTNPLEVLTILKMD